MWPVFITFIFLHVSVAKVPKVTLDHGGVLIGSYSSTIKGREIASYKGIPYAQPPVGDLRFKSPKPYPSWEGDRNAVNESSVCFQVAASIHGTEPVGQEDCLYLNVHVPANINRRRRRLPVMVWFHGGGWVYGSGGEDAAGPQYLLDKDVILVAGNYRLNIFGFLSSETIDCPGNFGLKDQVEILRWVKKHISSFGGDPNSVTIFGESSGAISVMYLMQSKKSQHLFHRAIAQSGTFYNPFGQPHRKGTAAEKAKRLAKQVNCDEKNNDWEKIIKCLRGLPGDTLIREFYKFYEWEFFPTVPLLAVIEVPHEDAFITFDPRKTSIPRNIPIMVGFNSQEGALFSAPIVNDKSMLQQLKDNFTTLMPLILYYDHLPEKKRNYITNQILSYYLKNGQDYDENNFENFTKIITDGMFFTGFDKYIRRRVYQTLPLTYAYLFNHRGSKSLTSILGGGSKFYGVSHADELQYIFPWNNILNITEPSPRDIDMRNTMVDLWTNFAIHGNPTPTGCKYQNWEPVDGLLWNYAAIESTDRRIKDRRIISNQRELAKDRIALWNSFSI